MEEEIAHRTLNVRARYSGVVVGKRGGVGHWRMAGKKATSIAQRGVWANLVPRRLNSLLHLSN